jgi:imidazolonepropionase-like amidohydrolase
VKQIVAISLVIGLAGSGVGTPAFQCDRSPLLVRNVDLWSPEGTQRRRDVLVVDGHIRNIAGPGRIQAPEGARVHDGRGQLMLPGLVDLHVHFVFPGPMGDRKADPVADALVFGRQMLASGVTSARLHLDTLEHASLLKDLAQDECSPMPRLQVAGPAFIPGTGTGDKNAVWDVAGVEDAVSKVRRSTERGFQWIAIHDPQKFPAASLAAIVATARQQQLRILGSGYTQPEVESSLTLAPDTLDYLDVSPQPEYAPALLEAARAHKQLTWVARIGIHDRYRAYQDNPALIDDASNYELFDAVTANALRQGVRQSIADRDSEHARRMDEAYPALHRKFQQALTSRIRLAMGTDVGSPGQFHRNAIWWELDSWVKHGASVDAALSAAAINGAKVLYGEGAAGLREGARADFVLCPADTFERRPIDGRGCRGYRSGRSSPRQTSRKRAGRG